MEYTKNYELRKPETNEYYDVEDFNENAEVIDEELGNLRETSHTHNNKSVLDKITETLISNWNNAFSHITDSIKHITAEERNLWNTVKNKSDSGHTHKYAGSSSVGGSANSAVKATQDSSGQQINTTYIKGLSVSGKTITYTKGDGTTGTITTQDTNTDTNTTYKLTKSGSTITLTGSDGSTTSVTDANANTTYTAATLSVADTAGYFNGNTAETVFAEIWKALKYPNQTITGAVNWNNYMVNGVYKIQNCTMTAAYNAPVNVYSFGILIVIHPEQGGEDRCYQIYIPHNNENVYYARAYNSGWGTWRCSTDHTHSYLPLSGGTVTGTTVFSKTTDLLGTANNSPAIIVGGTATTAHLEIDPNEIHAKTNGTSVAPLYLNSDGGLVTVGTGGLQVNGAINSTGTIKGSSIYNAVWNADYAEGFEYIGDKPKVGEIVEIADKRKVQKANKNSNKIIGIVSDSYCILAGCDENDVKNGNKIAIGLLGQLPIKIVGKVEAGDFITSVGNGIGKVAEENAPRGSIIGRALESNSEEDIKMVYCLIQPQ